MAMKLETFPPPIPIPKFPDLANFEASGGSPEEMILASLLECDDEGLEWILEELSKERTIFSKVATKARDVARCEKVPGSLDVRQRSKDTVHLVNKAAMVEDPIVQFSAFMYFCMESEGEVKIDVVRLGRLDRKSEVHYATKDGTARAGKKYYESKGKLIFEPGVAELEIVVPIISNRAWDTTTEFELVLSNGECCRLGNYLCRSRVKIIDVDSFPTNKFSKQIQAQDLISIPTWDLLMEYFKLTWANPVVKRGTRKAMVLDQLHNLNYIWKLTLNVLLVDVVLANKEAAGLLLITILSVIPFACLHILDYRKLDWKIGGGSRTMLQTALVRKFLNYTEESTAQLDPTDLIMAMTGDTTALVHDGYIKFLEQIKLFSALLYIIVFLVVIPQTQGKPVAWLGLAVVAVFPTALYLFGRLRRRKTVESKAEENSAQSGIVSQVSRIIQNQRMIKDYNRRPFFVKRTEDRCAAYNKARVTANKFSMNNVYAAKWLTTICIALYIILEGIRHIQSDFQTPTLGMFIANLSIINKIGGIFEIMYGNFSAMESIIPSLLHVVKLLNLPIDLHQRMRLDRSRRKNTSLNITGLDGGTLDGLPLDFMPIKVDVGKLRIGSRMQSLSELIGCEGITPAGIMQISQGCLATLIGPRHKGKTSLLKVIGGVLLPEPEGCFIPSHLRVLHITTETLFFQGTLYENLVYGVEPGHHDRRMERVEIICKRLWFSEKTLKLVQQGDIETNEKADILPWNESLSLTERYFCQLARALISNPEVLCTHKPTMPFNDDTAYDILVLLKEFCVEKGFVQEASEMKFRRPRTCIMTSTDMNGLSIIDYIFKVDMSELPCVKELSKEDVTDTMLS